MKNKNSYAVSIHGFKKNVIAPLSLREFAFVSMTQLQKSNQFYHPLVREEETINSATKRHYHK